MKRPVLLLSLLLLLSASPGHAADYSRAVASLQSLVQSEMKQWGISGISIALVDDRQTIHAEGFGEATKDSIFRVGSG